MFIKQESLIRGLQKGLSFGSLLLGLVAATSAVNQSLAQGVLSSPDQPGHQQVAAAPARKAALRDGTYLYGASSQPGQIRQEYFVFEVKNNHVVGAAYMPRSDFDCFYGNLDNRQLDLTIVSSFGNEAYDYDLNLQYYEPIDQVSENDERILETCKADVANTWQAQQ